MSNRLLSAMALLALGLATSVQAQSIERVYNIENFGNASGPVINDSFDLPEVVSVESISMTIAHDWMSDLEMVITGPDGDVYTPFFDAGSNAELGDGAGFGLANTVIDIFLPPGTIGTTIGAAAGSPRPAGAYDAETWGDGSPAGTWNISLIDDASDDDGSIGSVIINYNAVPEPSMFIFGLLGMLGMILLRRRS